MKLVDLLAREWDNWPIKCKYAVCDMDGEIRAVGTNTAFDFYPTEEVDAEDKISGFAMLGNDQPRVTRPDWQSARDKLKGETKVPKANKDGWVRHRGGKCPVEAGVKVEYKMRDGSVSISFDDGASLRWVHRGTAGDIMAYRIHAPKQAEKSVEQRIIDAEQVALAVQANAEAEMPAAKPVDGPLQWRDRIKEIDATVVALEDERVGLIQRLADEGLALLRVDGKAIPSEPIKAEDSAQGEDMSDPANWLQGDLVECVENDRFPNIYKKGKLYEVLKQGSAPTVRDELGGKSACTLNLRDAQCFKWHSRP